MKFSLTNFITIPELSSFVCKSSRINSGQMALSFFNTIAHLGYITGHPGESR